MYVVICDTLYTTEEFEGTYEECENYIENNKDGYLPNSLGIYFKTEK